MGKIFGTDGVRGLANDLLTPEIALQLGITAARVITAEGNFKNRKAHAVVGRDTRLSGEMLSQAICAGLASAGVDVTDVGVLPTPGVAFIASQGDVDLAAVISASHNPMPDNGIKFFAHGGYKLDDAIEEKMESLLGESWKRPIADGVGSIEVESTIADREYLDHLHTCIRNPRKDSIRGLRIVLDCANGATSAIAPLALQEAGVDVMVMNSSPDGRNINAGCGSTHPEQLAAIMVASDADFGVAFDGDADRCLAMDHEGNLVDGDQIMGILALAMQRRGELAHNTLVVTVMSNLGLLIAMEKAGIKTVQTAVGDRYVLEAMRANGYTLGGEQSGHIISSKHATTGDGTLTALLLAQEVKESGLTLAELATQIPRLPQTLVNVRGVDKGRVDDVVLQQAVRAAERKLGSKGRVILRASGTEPLVRVMVEAANQADADEVANNLADVVKERINLGS